MTTTASPPTREALERQLEGARAERVAAEKQLGAAVLDSSEVAAAKKAVSKAEAAEAGALAAIEEAERRELQSAEEQTANDARLARLEVYAWVRDALPAAAAVAEARAALQSAEESAASVIKAAPRWPTLKRAGSQRQSDSPLKRLASLRGTGLDAKTVRTAGRLIGRRHELDLDPELSPERCRELLARVEELISAEETGTADATAVTADALEAQQQADHQERKAAFEAKQEAAHEEAVQRRAERASAVVRVPLGRNAGMTQTDDQRRSEILQPERV